MWLVERGAQVTCCGAGTGTPGKASKKRSHVSPGERRFGHFRLNRSGRKTGTWQKYCWGRTGGGEGGKGGVTDARVPGARRSL